MDMSRRTLLAGAGMLALSPELSAAPQPLVKLVLPPKLKPGDRIAIVAPAGAADDQAHIARASAKVAALGYVPVPMPNVLKRFGYLAGTDEERATDMNQAIRDPDIDGIFYLRGGYGSMRILPLLDYAALEGRPKMTIGFSDVTALHLGILAKSGVVTFHGPCAESSWSDFSKSTVGVFTRDAVFGIAKHPAADGIRRTTLVTGKAKGPLIAGNLSLVVSLIGTPFMPNLKGAILALEDIGEDPYRIDRMLSQVLLATAGKGLAGLAFGNFRQRLRPGEIPEVLDPKKTFSTEQVLLERAKAFGVPAYSGLSFGHIGLNHVLPLGVTCELDADRCELKIGQAVQ